MEIRKKKKTPPALHQLNWASAAAHQKNKDAFYMCKALSTHGNGKTVGMTKLTGNELSPTLHFLLKVGSL